MKFGTSYYPEITPEAEWATDLQHMREARFSVIRMLEFAWSALEPREGEYTFDWLDHFLDLAHAHDLQVILCTPSATPPAWLGLQYPEVFAELADGSRRQHGGRRDMDLDHEVYRFFSEQIATHLGQRYGAHPAVIGWQIDNELFGVEGPDLPPGCHTRAATFRFRQYLKRVHGDLATLNERWGTRFWSHEYSAWGEIETARHPRATLGQWLDFNRWFNESLTDFLRLQAEALRRVIAPGQFITHNSTAIFDRGIDHAALAVPLDIAGWDAYFGAAGNPHPESFAALAHDLFRCAKRKPFLVLETGALPQGPGGSAAYWAEMRAHGADMVIIWHWRGHRSGAERNSNTFCDHAGRPRAERVSLMQDLAARAELTDPLPEKFPPRKAAIYFSADCVTAFLSPNPYSKPQRPLPYLRVLIEAYHAFRQLGIGMDVVRPGENLDPYDLLLLPAAKLLDEPEAGRIAAFVERGGTLFSTAKLAHEDSWGRYYPVPGAPLADVLGISLREDARIREGLVIRTTDGKVFPSEAYGDRVEVTTATLLASADAWPAATVHPYGSGRAFHAALFSPGLFAHLAPQACAAAGLEPGEPPAEGVVRFPALDGRGIWTFNYSNETKVVGGVEVPALDFSFAGTRPGN